MYYIASPPYRPSSAGIRVLYRLQQLLTEMGEDAVIINTPTPIHRKDVLIVPECFGVESFYARRMVRYYLNKPLEGVIYGTPELTLTYNEDDYPAADLRLQILCMEPFFRNEGGPRPHDGVYIGKGTQVGEFPPHTILVTHDWPETRRELAAFLNKCERFYSYDDKTALLTEAKACGCDIFVLQNNEWVSFQLQPVAPYEEALQRLVDMTK